MVTWFHTAATTDMTTILLIINCSPSLFVGSISTALADSENEYRLPFRQPMLQSTVDSHQRLEYETVV